MAAAPADFSHVRVHTEADAAASARAIHAKAYTTGSDIVFAAGQYRPDTWAGRQLLAHELTHVLQQAGRANGGPAPAIQRAVEVRPPGRGEASAFDRRDELIARMNAVSGGMTYSLDGQRIAYEVRDEAALTNFDQQMRRLIDRAEVIPMRLITSAGRVPNGAGGFDPLLFDSFILGYVDLDDLLASDDNAFQLVLVHLLTERAAVRNYARRIGTDMSASFNRAHAAGRAAENEFIQNLVNDPSIRFNYEEVRPNGTLVVAWRSAAEGYRVFHVIRRAAREERGGEVWAQLADGTRLTIEQLIERRRAAAPAPAGP